MRVLPTLAILLSCVGASNECDSSASGDCVSEEVSLLQAIRSHTLHTANIGEEIGEESDEESGSRRRGGRRRCRRMGRMGRMGRCRRRMGMGGRRRRGGQNPAEPQEELEYMEVEDLPHTRDAGDAPFGIEVVVDPPEMVASVTVTSDWWMKRPKDLSVFIVDSNDVATQVASFEFPSTLDICGTNGDEECSYPNTPTSRVTIPVESGILASAVLVEVLTPRNEAGQPNGQVIIEGVTVATIPTYNYGAMFTNSCPSSGVSESECLAAVQSLLGSDQSQGRSSLVAGSWGWVPPGCSVQSHFTRGRNGDFAAHYNRNDGGENDGGYTPVCSSQCQHLHNQDVVGGTFSHYGADHSDSPSDAACSASCTASLSCTAWVRQPSTGRCWLSNQAVVTFEDDSDRTTGLRCN